MTLKRIFYLVQEEDSGAWFRLSEQRLRSAAQLGAHEFSITGHKKAELEEGVSCGVGATSF